MFVYLACRSIWLKRPPQRDEIILMACRREHNALVTMKAPLLPEEK
jgi:hypothetical protein